MAESIRSVGIDWDDTYVQTFGAKSAHHKAVAEQFYGYELTDETLLTHWGTGLRNELPIFYGFTDGVDDAKFAELLDAFNDLDHLYPKPLHEDTLEFHTSITPLTPWVLTSHLTPNATKEIRRAGIDPSDFQFIHGSDITIALAADGTPSPGPDGEPLKVRKPNPQVFDMAKQALSELGINPEECVYIGDTLDDAISSTEAGLQFVGVASGRVSLEEFRDNNFRAEARLRDVSRYLLSQTVLSS
jgi:beta-phosphoglucomutase-like phosphatase (HAD superfamily)